jgi:hypothetical protein
MRYGINLCKYRIGQEPLLGAIPMEEMDLFVHPSQNQLLPMHPDGAIMTLK